MKCPRCELNYIDAEKQAYCDVCLKEMKGIALDNDEIEEAEDELPTELCPICNENMMRAGEKMCEECRRKAEFEDEPDPDDDDDEWREYLDDDTDSDLDGELDESLKEEFDVEIEDEEEDEEEYADEEEDLEYVTGDEIYSIADDDDDDDDGEDEDF
jgi:hypothetical protein